MDADSSPERTTRSEAVAAFLVARHAIQALLEVVHRSALSASTCQDIAEQVEELRDGLDAIGHAVGSLPMGRVPWEQHSHR